MLKVCKKACILKPFYQICFRHHSDKLFVGYNTSIFEKQSLSVLIFFCSKNGLVSLNLEVLKVSQNEARIYYIFLLWRSIFYNYMITVFKVTLKPTMLIFNFTPLSNLQPSRLSSHPTRTPALDFGPILRRYTKRSDPNYKPTLLLSVIANNAPKTK